MGLFITAFFVVVAICMYVFQIKEWYENRFDWRGFNKDNGKHRNGTLYDNQGFDKDGFDQNGYNREGFNKLGFNRSGYDIDGYDKDGYDSLGFDKSGYDKDGYNSYGYGSDGYDRKGYDKRGYDREGYNGKGFNVNGIHKNGTRYDDCGFDKFGYDRNGYNREGCNLCGTNKTEIHKFQILQTPSTCEKNPEIVNSTANSVDSEDDSKNVPINNSKSNEKQCVEEINAGLYLSDFERLIYPINNSDDEEDCEYEYTYVSVIYDDYTVCDFELGEDISLPLTTNPEYSYCTFEDNLSTTNNYHTHLDCFKYWEIKNKNTFLRANTWYLVDPIHIYNDRMKKCKICQSRDELGKDMF